MDSRHVTRISVHLTDPGYRPDACLWGVRVDGAPLGRCQTADAAEGVAYVHVEDQETGKLMLNERRDEFVTDEIRGRVELIPPSPERIRAWLDGQARRLARRSRKPEPCRGLLVRPIPGPPGEDDHG